MSYKKIFWILITLLTVGGFASHSLLPFGKEAISATIYKTMDVRSLANPEHKNPTSGYAVYKNEIYNIQVTKEKDLGSSFSNGMYMGKQKLPLEFSMKKEPTLPVPSPKERGLYIGEFYLPHIPKENMDIERDVSVYSNGSSDFRSVGMMGQEMLNYATNGFLVNFLYSSNAHERQEDIKSLSHTFVINQLSGYVYDFHERYVYIEFPEITTASDLSKLEDRIQSLESVAYVRPILFSQETKQRFIYNLADINSMFSTHGFKEFITFLKKYKGIGCIDCNDGIGQYHPTAAATQSIRHLIQDVNKKDGTSFFLRLGRMQLYLNPIKKQYQKDDPAPIPAKGYMIEGIAWDEKYPHGAAMTRKRSEIRQQQKIGSDEYNILALQKKNKKLLSEIEEYKSLNKKLLSIVSMFENEVTTIYRSEIDTILELPIKQFDISTYHSKNEKLIDLKKKNYTLIQDHENAEALQKALKNLILNTQEDVDVKAQEEVSGCTIIGRRMSPYNTRNVKPLDKKSYWTDLDSIKKSHPEILRYRIQFAGGTQNPLKTPWFTPGQDDIDFEDEMKHMWRYFDDYSYEIELCEEDEDTLTNEEAYRSGRMILSEYAPKYKKHVPKRPTPINHEARADNPDLAITHPKPGVITEDTLTIKGITKNCSHISLWNDERFLAQNISPNPNGEFKYEGVRLTLKENNFYVKCQTIPGLISETVSIYSGPLGNKLKDASNTCYIRTAGATATNNDYWSKLGLDTSANPEVHQYQIRWTNGEWSGWYVPGKDDIDEKSGGTMRQWHNFETHHFRVKMCEKDMHLLKNEAQYGASLQKLMVEPPTEEEQTKEDALPKTSNMVVNVGVEGKTIEPGVSFDVILSSDDRIADAECIFKGNGDTILLNEVNGFSGSFQAPDEPGRYYGDCSLVNLEGAMTIEKNAFGVHVADASGELSKFQIHIPNQPLMANKSSSMTITASGEHGNRIHDYQGAVKFWSGSPTATLPDTYTFGLEDKGMKTFEAGVSFPTRGSHTIYAKEIESPNIQSGLTVQVNADPEQIATEYLSLLEPKAGEYPLGTLMFKGDTNVCTSVNIIQDGSSIGSTNAQKDGSFLWYTDSLKEGLHSFHLECSNLRSVKSDAIEIEIVNGYKTMQNTESDSGIRIITPIEGTYKSNRMTITGVAENCDTLTIYNGKKVMKENLLIDNDSGFLMQTNRLVDGDHSFLAQCEQDESMISKPVEITVDRTPPSSFTVSMLPETSVAPGETILLSISAEEELSKASCTFDGINRAHELYDDMYVGSHTAPDVPGEYSVSCSIFDVANNELGDPKALTLTVKE